MIFNFHPTKATKFTSIFLLTILLSCQRDFVYNEKDNKSTDTLEIEKLYKKDYISSEGMTMEEKIMSDKDLDIDNQSLMNIKIDETGKIMGLDEFDPDPNFDNVEVQEFAEDYYKSFNALKVAIRSENKESIKNASIEIELMYQKQQMLISKLPVKDAFELARWMTLLNAESVNTLMETK